MRPPSFIFWRIRIQIGSATFAPSMPGPRLTVFMSLPTHTPTVYRGVIPMNQASVKSLVVPVLPARLSLSDAAAAPVPRWVTPFSIWRS